MDNPSFEFFLQQRGYQPKTIYSYNRLLNTFRKWCKEQDINPVIATLEDLYGYKNACMEKGFSSHNVRKHLIVLKHYFVFLGREENPALLVKHKKKEHTLPEHLLSEEELKELYRSFEAMNMVQRRNKVMLGMVIFQGLKREELGLLELEHVNLEDASVYVLSTTKTNSRSIELHPMQMKDLLAYVYDYRPCLLREAGKETNCFFFSMGKGNVLYNAIQKKMNNLRAWHPALKSLSQLRESRMSIWVKQYGLRKAQYLSGIKYTSSMLRYKIEDIEQLKRKLAVVHPMERMREL